MIGIIGCFKLDKHQIHCSVWAHQVDDFHHSIVHRDEGQKQIKVACAKYQGKKDLTFARQAWKQTELLLENV